MKKQPIKKAVALKYEPSSYDAPHVVAKGAGVTADKIIEQASRNDIKIHEDQALIQLLYQLDLNEQIPPDLYPIIAEVFTLIYHAEEIAGRLNHV